MKYTYLCRKYNPYDDFNLCPIVDETEMLSSPACLHIFENKVSSEKYCVISDCIGSPMPCLSVDGEFVVGTSHYVYFINISSRKIVHRFLLHSPCIVLLTAHNKTIAICENDVLVITYQNKSIIGEFSFNDIIIDYTLDENCLVLHLMEGEESVINL